MYLYNFELIRKIGQEIKSGENVILCKDINVTDINDCSIHNHDFYEIQYVYQGEGVEIIKEHNFALNEGVFSVIAPPISHTYYSTNSLIIFNICIIPTTEQKRILDKLPLNFSTNRDICDEFEILFDSLGTNLSKKRSFNVNNYINIILNLLLDSSYKGSVSNTKWAKLLAETSNNYATITLDDAVKICNLSKSYFCRAFKNEFKVTFLQYLDNIKIEKSKVLLQTTDTPISEIVYLVGFNNPTRYFSSFKSNVGMSPLKYRKQFSNVIK